MILKPPAHVISEKNQLSYFRLYEELQDKGLSLQDLALVMIKLGCTIKCGGQLETQKVSD